MLLALVPACTFPGVGVPSVNSLDFERKAPGNAFYAIVAVGGTSTAGLTITSSRGTVGPIERRADGRYQALVTPDALGTGEYRVQAKMPKSMPLTRTALVLVHVGAAWNQPERVRGLVNTRGWEDGVYITPDGNWLFVEYTPVSPSCVWVDPADCDTAVGPVGPPDRPGFIGTERIHSDGTIANSCLGIASLPTKLPPTSYWGFRRLPDGSFSNPFRIGFVGSGGCLTPLGLDVYPHGDGTATYLFSFHDLRKTGSADTGPEFYAVDAPLGKNLNLGTWNGTWPTATIDGFDATRLRIAHGANELGVNGYGVVGASGTIDELWFDNEFLAGHHGIYVTTLASGGTWPAGPWAAFAEVPAPVSVAGGDERMPFFDGHILTARVGSDIAQSTFTGSGAADLTKPGAFGAYDPILVPDPAAAKKVGAIMTLGEPTLTADGKHLYFDYGVLRSDGLYDIDVGVVDHR